MGLVSLEIPPLHCVVFYLIALCNDNLAKYVGKQLISKRENDTSVKGRFPQVRLTLLECV